MTEWKVLRLRQGKLLSSGSKPEKDIPSSVVPCQGSALSQNQFDPQLHLLQQISVQRRKIEHLLDFIHSRLIHPQFLWFQQISVQHRKYASLLDLNTRRWNNRKVHRRLLKVTLLEPDSKNESNVWQTRLWLQIRIEIKETTELIHQ